MEGKNINLVNKGDVLLASTGDGTLGKACVFDREIPAIADSHVTIIRVDPKTIHPYYLADYLRIGFGAQQINRLFTGATGLIELTPEQVNDIVIELPESLSEQENISKAIREYEKEYSLKVSEAEDLLLKAQNLLI